MTRVRGFTQDDAHLFLREDQLQTSSSAGLVKLVFPYLAWTIIESGSAFETLIPTSSWRCRGLEQTGSLGQAVRTLGVDYVEELGEAAFYGPKIDFVVKDVIGREWQLGTVQVDYNLPERFDLSYVGSDNQNHRPVMIHRAPFGSMERFCGLLIEHFAGNFPTWLAPEQVRILPMNDDLISYADECLDEFKSLGIRATIDDQSAKLGAKIRKAETDKIPHMIILGKREAEEAKVSIRSRNNPSFDGTCDLKACADKIAEEIKAKSLPQPRDSNNQAK